MSDNDSVTAEELLSNLPDALSLFNVLNERIIGEIVFYDYTLAEWTDSMLIHIPKNPDLPVIRELIIQTANKLQQASMFYSFCASYNGFLTSSVEEAKNQIIVRMVDDYRERNAKRPAANVLDHLADSKFKDPLIQLLISRLLKEFWKERRDTLIEVRKMLEQLNLSQTMEMKYTQSL